MAQNHPSGGGLALAGPGNSCWGCGTAALAAQGVLGELGHIYKIDICQNLVFVDLIPKFNKKLWLYKFVLFVLRKRIR